MGSKAKIIYISVFSFLVCFLLIGYAALTDNLTLTGDISGEPQENIFITDVTVDGSEISKVDIDGFYGAVLYQTITLAAANDFDDSDETYYIVKLYNNSEDKWFYDGHSFSGMLPSGVKFVIEELQDYNDTTVTSTNVISSIIDPHGYDYFKLTYKNESSSDVTITQDIGFNYIKLENQVKVVFEYEGVEYVKYAEYVSDNEYKDVTFNQISIDLSDESTNRVARCNNGAILSLQSKYLKVSNITNYSGAEVGELDVSCKLFETLTSSVNYNEGVFENDTTPNNFLVLKNIIAGVEPSSPNAVVQQYRDFSINLYNHPVIVSNTIENYGKLKIYDSEKSGGRLHKQFNSLTDFTDYTSTHNVKVIENKNLIEHYGSDQSISSLEICDITMELWDQVDNALKAGSAFAYYYEFPAIVVAYEGITTISNCSLHSNTGYGVYKKSAYAGDYEERVANPTNPESKVLIENSQILCVRNNCVRFSDGNGIISIVDSKLYSSMDLAYDDTDNELFGDYKSDPIFVGEHFFEGLNNSTIREEFSEFYEDATTNIKVYLTGGETYCNNTDHINHFYSANTLNARLYYTKSAHFYTLQSDGKVYESDVFADTWDTSFEYSRSMINGNGAEDAGLYSSITTTNDYSFGYIVMDSKTTYTLSNHYLNKDGWYYIKTAVTDEVPNPDDEDYDSNYKMKYNTEDYRKSAELTNLTHNGKIVRVGDSFELINFNNPGTTYVDLDGYERVVSFYKTNGSTNTAPLTNFFAPLENISDSMSMADYMGMDNQFTFLASCDEGYFNVVTLGNLSRVFHIENVGTASTNNVGIKYIDTSLIDNSTGNILVSLDKVEQRFMLMKFMHYNAESNYYASDDAHPSVFVSQFNSVLSYLTTRIAETDEYGNSVYDSNGIPVWDTTVYFADKYFKGDGYESITTPGFLDTTSPYEYEVSSYLLSNISSPKYQRNGWYLWQDATPTINTKIWNEERYANLMYLAAKAQIQNGDNTLDDNTSLYVSSQAVLTSYGISLETDFTNSSTDDNYGYIRISSQERILGLRINVAAVNTTTNTAAPSLGSWLLVRTYSSTVLSESLRLDCPFKYADILNGKNTYGDQDQNLVEGEPPYVVITQTDENASITFTILFDLDKISSDIHMVELDPFDFGNCDNTILIKTITIISDVKDYLK